jgi:ABC-type Zn uptake system ZnuABC Zn-binding protein ZnuA
VRRLVVAGLLALAAGPSAAGPLRVVATVPDLGSLVRQLGGEEVDVVVLTKGPQDPHYVEPRPSFIRALHRADLFVLTGMDLEKGWAPVLLGSARNADILPGSPGYLDASVVIEPLQVPGAGADRALGDLHPYGNPHYLTDPVNGLRVATLIRDKLSELLPEGASRFRAARDAFSQRLLEQLLGPELLERHPADALAARIESGGLDGFLRDAGQLELLGGWLGALRDHRGTRAAEEHQFWAYFARRFGLELVTTLEPFPGIAPTTRHLAKVVRVVEAEDVRVILSSAYFDPSHARWVAERTGARVVPMAHQSGARDGAEDYLGTIDYNVRRLLEALQAG